ncbi:hypothetical protein NB640_11090 [Oxalobacter vibrioformis]|uniref:Uncharacterized protein n=1 Tax=Oxalobacter vibrioformis TaxID=933080 RepID=A0A9E9LYD9_9BURK|nr:hypothetical protein [Oxalobacter vibrioformis]WAW09757.1 hypothetical protein NB640_11090 [Oxalobacter vibrioformis]
MKTDRISKLYDGLNSEELAVLRFNSYIDASELEEKRIIDAIPRFTFEKPITDPAYWRHLTAISAFAAAWGISYWKLMAGRYIANTTLLFDGVSDEQFNEAFSNIGVAESRLLALENVLVILCDKYGIKADTVRIAAGGVPTSSLDPKEIFMLDIKPDLEYQEEMQSAFEQLLSE